MPKLNTTTSGIITATLTADSSPTLELQQNGVAIRTLGESQLVMGTAQSTATGAVAYDFTGIPSWAKRITVMFSGVSTNAAGAASIIIQLGVSGVAVTSGYTGANSLLGASTVSTGISSTAGFVMAPMPAAAATWTGQMVISNITGNTWVSSSSCSRTDSATIDVQNGLNALSGTLNLVRVTTTNGTDTFDAGTVNIMWE